MGCLKGVIPLAVDAFDGFGLQSQGINFARRAEHAGDHGNVEAFDVFKDQRGTFVAAEFS